MKRGAVDCAAENPKKKADPPRDTPLGMVKNGCRVYQVLDAIGNASFYPAGEIDFLAVINDPDHYTAKQRCDVSFTNPDHGKRLGGILEYFYHKRFQPGKFTRLLKAVVHDEDNPRDLLMHPRLAVEFVKAVEGMYAEANDPDHIFYYQEEMVPAFAAIMDHLGVKTVDDMSERGVATKDANKVFALFSKFVPKDGK